MFLTKDTLLGLCLLLLPATISAQALYTKPCPLLNLNYPAVSSCVSSDVVKSAIAILNDNITRALDQPTVYGQLQSTANAFSIDVYCLHDEDSIFTYHHTPDELMAQHSVGVTTVDSNTVYRIGSISKMLTVYMFLIAAGDGTWNQPVTNFVPELAAYVEMNQGTFQNDMIDIVDWKSITVGALASQMSGIAREEAYSPAFEQALQKAFNLPPTSRNESATCGDGDVIRIPCDRTAFFNDFLKQHPFTSPFTTPIYSNAAFQILGYAIENITGKPLSELFNKTLIQRLDLNGTYYTVPSSPDTSIIPVNETVSLWDFDALGEAPTGGYFSSINDLRKIGKSILNSTLLTPAQTRRWMKPHAFTANINFAVGAPWEILRAPGDPVSWIYSKTGAFGAYGGIIALIPEYDVGITVLGAGTSAPDAARILSDMVVDSISPTIYAASKAAAASIYTGVYSNSTTNSTITISNPDSSSGLLVSEWTINGTQTLPLLASFFGVNQTTQSLSVLIFPSDLTADNGTTVSWRVAFQILPQPLDPGVFSENCVSWGAANSIAYGGIGFDEFVFTLNEAGIADSVEPRVMGLEIMRAGEPVAQRSSRRLRRVRIG